MNWIRLAQHRALPAFAVVVASYCAYYLLARFPWSAAIESVAALDVSRFVSISVLGLLAVWLLRGLRFLAIARAHGVHLRFIDSYLYTAIAIGLGAVTPLQTGESLKFSILRKTQGFSIAALARLFLAERVVDVLVLAILTSIAVSAAFEGLIATLGMLLGCAALVIYIVMAFWSSSPKVIAEFLFVGAQQSRDKLTILATTLACWIITSITWGTVIGLADIKIGFVQSLLLTGVVTFANVLSAIPGGLGISEVSTALLLQHMGVSGNAAHAGALVLRLLTLLVLFLGALHWIVWSMRRQQ